MIILGIDPGTARTGYGVIKSERENISAVGFGCILTNKDSPREKRLETLHDELMQIIKDYRPDVIAQELLYFSKNAKTALQVGEARGVILLAAAKSMVPIEEYTPLQVKESLTGYGRASKNEIQEIVKMHLDIVKFRGLGNDDAADALAIALCHIFTIETGGMK